MTSDSLDDTKSSENRKKRSEKERKIPAKTF